MHSSAGDATEKDDGDKVERKEVEKEEHVGRSSSSMSDRDKGDKGDKGGDKHRRERLHKSSSKDKHEKDRSATNLRDRDRDRDKDADKDRHKDAKRDREKDHDRGRDRDKDRHKDHRDKHRDKDRDKEHGGEGDKELAREEKAKVEHEKGERKESRESKKDKIKEKSKEGEQEVITGRPRSYSSSGRELSKKEKDREREKEKEKDKGRDKERDKKKEKERKKALLGKIMNSSLSHSRNHIFASPGSSPSHSPSLARSPSHPLSPTLSPLSSPSPAPSPLLSPPLLSPPLSPRPSPLGSPNLSSEPQRIGAVSRNPSTRRLDFEKLNATPKREPSDTLLKSFSITPQNDPFAKHLKEESPIFVKAIGLWKDLSSNTSNDYRTRSFSSFSIKDLPIGDFTMRTVAELEAPPSEQEQKDAVADFEDWITNWITKSTHKYLADRLAINEIILKRISSGNLSTLGLRELPVIRSTLRKMTDCFSDSDNSETARLLTQTVNEQVNLAVSLEGPNSKMAGHVRVSATYAKLPLQLIEVYRKSCEVALDELRMKETARYIDGTSKDKLSSWWLSLIQERVDHFLGQLGYDFMTVPQDYTLTPPRSIRRVRGNLTLINRCLSPTNDDDASSEGSTSRPPSPDRPLSPHERPTTPLDRPSTPASDRSTYSPSGESRLGSSSERTTGRGGTWGRSSMLRPAMSEQSITMYMTHRAASPATIIRNHRDSLIQLVEELREQIYGVIEEFIEEALIVLEDGLIQYMEENGVKTGYDDKIYNKGDREILELDAAELILRKCIVNDLVRSENVEKPSDHEESKFLLKYRNKETEGLANLNNLAKDIRYLYRMMELEDDSKVTSRLMDAVPVTGLILARMCTLENETRTVLELWEERAQEEVQSGLESPRSGYYTGYKKFKEGGGEGNILRILTEGGNMQRHGKRRILTTAVHVHIPTALDYLVFSTPDAAHSRVTKQIPVANLKTVEFGKTPAFCFHAVDNCCFHISLAKGNALNLETKTPLERDKWVAAFKWLLATRDTREAKGTIT